MSSLSSNGIVGAQRRFLRTAMLAWLFASGVAACGREIIIADASDGASSDATMDVAADVPVDASPDGTPDASACPGGLRRCGTACVDDRYDPANCGACGHACATSEVCNAGVCAATCTAPRQTCGTGSAARCVDLSSDNANCGACGNVCSAGRACVAGTCALTCASPLVACGTVCADTRFDPSHCGSCDTACQAGEFCSSGACVGAGACANDSDCDGLTIARCTAAVCNHGAYPGPVDRCVVVPSPSGTTCDDGLFCTTTDRCDGAGACVGSVANTCGMTAPECQQVVCDETADSCSVAPMTDGSSCTGSLCETGHSCTAGACHGTPVVCSGSNACGANTCDPATGACGAPPDGTSCDDHDICTTSDVCTTGACSGTRASDCTVHATFGFETCPSGWTLTGDWECGTPTNVGPASAHSGSGVLATHIASDYSNGRTYDATTADSPAIDLTTAVSPRLAFWAWIDTEGSTYDGFNLSSSTDGGTTWTQVTTVTPAYPLTIASRLAWGGRQSAAGWQLYHADLSALAGTTARLRFAFRSDVSGTYPGVYIDDLSVTEPTADPLQITTTTLPDALVATAYAVPLSRVGGSSNVVWSITGGTNHAWLAIDPATGALSGTPDASNAGPVSVSVRIQEAGVPGNFATATLDFRAATTVYFEPFDTCPAGWTLTGDWQCGTPTSVGPATAYSPTQCLGTQIASNYNDNQTWAGATATSPDIDLGSATSARLTMRLWIDTEGSTYDGANLKISIDGGATYTTVTTVTPAYSLTVDGQPAWGGHQAALGWQLVRADLTPYVGRTVRLRLAFRSDSSGTYPGAYVDDVWVSR